MRSKPIWFQLVLYVTAVLCGVVIGPVLIRGGSDVAQSSAAGRTVQDVAAPHVDVECTINQVTAFSSRIGVRCNEGFAPDGKIIYFAIETAANPQLSDQFLSVLLTAQALDKRVQIRYDPAISGAHFGCSDNDCRPFSGVRTLD